MTVNGNAAAAGRKRHRLRTLALSCLGAVVALYVLSRTVDPTRLGRATADALFYLVRYWPFSLLFLAAGFLVHLRRRRS